MGLFSQIKSWFTLPTMQDCLEAELASRRPAVENEKLIQATREDKQRVTLSGKSPDSNCILGPAPQPIDPVTGMHKDYWVLPETERAKGFVRPLRRSYIHVGGRSCGTVTSMGLVLSETYARDPKFYSHTFCCGCGNHYPVNEFVWDEDGQEVGS